MSLSPIPTQVICISHIYIVLFFPISHIYRVLFLSDDTVRFILSPLSIELFVIQMLAVVFLSAIILRAFFYQSYPYSSHFISYNNISHICTLSFLSVENRGHFCLLFQFFLLAIACKNSCFDMHKNKDI